MHFLAYRTALRVASLPVLHWETQLDASSFCFNQYTAASVALLVFSFVTY
jgi:hypothetical protein